MQSPSSGHGLAGCVLSVVTVEFSVSNPATAVPGVHGCPVFPSVWSFVRVSWRFVLPDYFAVSPVNSVDATIAVSVNEAVC